MSQSQRDAEEIKRLKEQLHKSFMQEMEKLFQMQMEHTKEEIEQRERKIKQKQEQIKIKYSEIETNSKARESCFPMQLDMDVSLVEVAYRKGDTLRDSGIETINILLSNEEDKRNQSDPDYQINKLKQLENNILQQVSNVPNCLKELLRMCNQLCLDNCRLRQDNLNCLEEQQVLKMKIFDSQRTIQKLKRSEKSLQTQNDQLNQLYGQQASQNALNQEQIRKVKDQWNGSKMQIIDLKKQIQKLTQLLKTTNRIDTSKLNFNIPSKSRQQQNGQRQKPNFLRMSSNAILIRHQKASTPITQTSQESQFRTPTADSQQKYFKRKDRSQYMVSKRAD